MLNLRLQKEYFDAIKSGRKTVEGRVNSPKYKNLICGAKIGFVCNKTEEKIICIIEALNVYSSFSQMLKAEGVSNMLPSLGQEELNKAVSIYEGFPGYKEEANVFGALAIKIKILNI